MCTFKDEFNVLYFFNSMLRLDKYLSGMKVSWYGLLGDTSCLLIRIWLSAAVLHLLWQERVHAAGRQPFHFGREKGGS